MKQIPKRVMIVSFDAVGAKDLEYLLDIRTISEQVMQKLFKALAMHYEFSLQGIM